MCDLLHTVARIIFFVCCGSAVFSDVHLLLLLNKQNMDVNQWLDCTGLHCDSSAHSMLSSFVILKYSSANPRPAFDFYVEVFRVAFGKA